MSDLEDGIRGSHHSLKIKEKKTKKERKLRYIACVYREEGIEEIGDILLWFPGTDDVSKHSVNETCDKLSNLGKNLHYHLSHRPRCLIKSEIGSAYLYT